MDGADVFVHAATRAFALGDPCPSLPADEAWADRAVSAGVLAPIVNAVERAGRPVPASLASVGAAAAARSMQALADLRIAGEVLDAAGVEWAVLKGLVLREVVFGQRHVRDCADLDLLVPPAKIRSALVALVRSRAVLYPADWSRSVRHGTAEVALVLRHGTVLDLHWSLVNDSAVRAATSIDTAALMARRRRLVLAGVDVWTLDPVDFVLHVLVHACMSGGSELRWLLDSQQALRWLAADTGALPARAREWGVHQHARVVLDAVARYVDPSVSLLAGRMAETSAWTRFLAALSRCRPPSAPSVHRDAARNWYRCTRSTGGASLAAAVATLAKGVGFRLGLRPTFSARSADLSDPEVAQWLRVAEAHARVGSQSR